jgi:hypothetical protein
MVSTPGSYSLSGMLEDFNGGEITAASLPATSLPLGISTLTLHFNSINIRQHGANGPYVLTAVNLANNGDPNVYDWKANVYSTPGYLVTQFAGVQKIFLPLVQFISPPPPVKGISGQLKKSGSPAAGINLELRFWNGSSYSTQASTTTDADGRYIFNSAPTLSAGQWYYVLYSNSTAAPNPGEGYLSYWYGNKLTSYTAGTDAVGGDFDLADVPQASPASNASVNLPANFCWTKRNIASDNYRIVFYDPVTQTYAMSGYLGSDAGCFNLGGLPSDWPSGRKYEWWLRVYQGTNPDAAPYNWGSSHFSRYVTINFSGGSPTDENGLQIVPTGEK